MTIEKDKFFNDYGSSNKQTIIVNRTSRNINNLKNNLNSLKN